VAASSSLGAVAVPSVVLVKGRRHYGGAGGGSHPMGAAVPGQFFLKIALPRAIAAHNTRVP
jgi:hypothetical protein